MSRSAEIRQMIIQQRVAEERQMLIAVGQLVDPNVHVEREGEVKLCAAAPANPGARAPPHAAARTFDPAVQVGE